MKFNLIILFILSNLYMSAQNQIKGAYNPKTKVFQPENDSIWIDDFCRFGIARFTKAGYMGLMDSTGKVLANPIYDYILNYNDTNFTYKLNNEVEVVAFVQATNKPLDFIDGLATETGTNGQLKLIDNKANSKSFEQSGQIPEYIDKYTLLSANPKRTQGVVLIPKMINKKQKYYYINAKFERVSDLYFDLAYNFVNNYAAVKYNDEWCILGINGELLKTKYATIIPVKNGTFIVAKKKYVYQGNLSYHDFGVIDNKGNILIPEMYGEIKYLFNDLYAVNYNPPTFSAGYLLYTSGYFVVDKYNKEFISPIKSNSETILPKDSSIITQLPKLNSRNPSSYPNYFRILQYSTVDEDEIELGECFKVKDIHCSGCDQVMNSFPTYNYDGEYFFFDKNGMINNKGYSEMSGEAFIRDYLRTNYRHYFRYNDNLLFFNDKQKPLLVKKDDKFEIIEFDEYNAYLPIGFGRILVSNYDKNKVIKFGMVNLEKDTIIPFEYESLQECAYNVLFAQKNGKWGLINYDNKIITPFEYDSLKINSTGAIASKNGKWGFIDFTGKIIVPFVFEEEIQGEYGLYCRYNEYINKRDYKKIRIKTSP